MTDIVTAIAWLVGSAFALLAAVGVLRMPDVFTRMQASTKASTLGLACLLIGTALQMGDLASFIRAASIGAFVLLTTPVSGLVIARASYFAGVPLWTGTVLDERNEIVTAGPRKTTSGSRGSGEQWATAFRGEPFPCEPPGVTRRRAGRQHRSMPGCRAVYEMLVGHG